MATFVMLGKYSLEGLRGITAKRSDEATALVKRHGGELKAAYAVLGQFDLVVIVELPDTAQAMKTSAELTKLLGVDFTTAPAVTIEEFDKSNVRWMIGAEFILEALARKGVRQLFMVLGGPHRSIPTRAWQTERV